MTRTAKRTDSEKIMPILAAVLGDELAAAVIDHRDTLREPLTEYAAKLQVREYLACGDPVAAAEMQILRGWRAIKCAWFQNEMRKEQRQQTGHLGRRTIADAADTFNARYGNFDAPFGLPSIERH